MSMTFDDFSDRLRHADEWTIRGLNYCIVVRRHSVEPSGGDGPHRWCVYAYVYPMHRLFPAMHQQLYTWKEPYASMPLHGGCSLRQVHMGVFAVSSIQVGADYNHLYDTAYTWMETREEATPVFRDAFNLWNHFHEEMEE
jgi:hypothetical protein